MRKYLYSENGFTEKAEWQPNCWVNVECPDNDDFKFLTEELKVPESFLEDIADVDERPRTETEDNWLLTILRIPTNAACRSSPCPSALSPMTESSFLSAITTRS